MKRPTISDIAARAGVSTGAVSYALNGQAGVSAATRERIIKIADELGWRPNVAARALSVSRADAVGWVVARPARILGVEPFFMQFTSGLEAELSAKGMAMLLQLAPDHESSVEAVGRWWAERRIDGVIVTDIMRNDQRVAALDRSGAPAVLVGRPLAGSKIPGVFSDDTEATELAVEHLIGLGHRRIARVAGLDAFVHTRERTQAFRAIMLRYGVTDPPVVNTDYSWEQGADAVRLLLSSPDRPTAIIFENDVMAVAAVAAARGLGLQVPVDVSIIAGDDSTICLMSDPPLTAICRDVMEYGKQVAETMLAVIGGGRPESFCGCTSSLRVRQTTAPPRDLSTPERSGAAGVRASAATNGSAGAAPRSGSGRGPRRAGPG